MAAKLRNKVVPAGAKPVVDFYIVNEKNVNGMHNLSVQLTGPDGNSVFTKETKVDVTGGEEFGQLLLEGLELPALASEGYYKVSANLTESAKAVCHGYDEVFVVDYLTAETTMPAVSVIESDGVVKAFLQQSLGISTKEYKAGTGEEQVIIIANHEMEKINKEVVESVLDQVSQGGIRGFQAFAWIPAILTGSSPWEPRTQRRFSVQEAFSEPD